MKKLNDNALKLLARMVYSNVKKAHLVCMCLDYQPKIPENVKTASYNENKK